MILIQTLSQEGHPGLESAVRNADAFLSTLVNCLYLLLGETSGLFKSEYTTLTLLFLGSLLPFLYLLLDGGLAGGDAAAGTFDDCDTASETVAVPGLEPATAPQLPLMRFSSA